MRVYLYTQLKRGKVMKYKIDLLVSKNGNFDCTFETITNAGPNLQDWFVNLQIARAEKNWQAVYKLIDKIRTTPDKL